MYVGKILRGFLQYKKVFSYVCYLFFYYLFFISNVKGIIGSIYPAKKTVMWHGIILAPFQSPYTINKDLFLLHLYQLFLHIYRVFPQFLYIFSYLVLRELFV